MSPLRRSDGCHDAVATMIPAGAGDRPPAPSWTVEQLRAAAREACGSDHPDDVAAAIETFEEIVAGLERRVGRVGAVRPTPRAPSAAAIAKVLEAFEVGVFVRNVARDGEPGWAVKLLPYLAALAELREGAASPGGWLTAPMENEPFGDGLIDVLSRAAQMLWDTQADRPADRPTRDAVIEMGRICSGRATRIQDARGAAAPPDATRAPSEAAILAAIRSAVLPVLPEVDDWDQEKRTRYMVEHELRAAYAVDFGAPRLAAPQEKP